MTSLDDLWFLADEAEREAERTYYRLREAHDDYLERTATRGVSRHRFRTLAERIRDHGAPYGAHTVVYRDSGELLLVRDTVVEQWVPPGGAIDGDESFREAAERELGEEAGVEAEFEGLGLLTRVRIRADGYETWGVLPVFAARAVTHEPDVSDPDGEIAEARWFDEIPENTRDREDLVAWRDRILD
ncbi:NUDIX hydrolase [Halobacteriales archaeon QS_8_69_26]|nr:MAG: NUDIX hydrolase [Halobacteriales archaeon QS_8_69_26]